ncbi:UNVERIFIED_CONTAM: multimeric flavodoxin WrbA [Acetivibrio alkalicellulosi]
MKITAVMGSPTKDGNTCVLAREVLKGASDLGAQVEEIFLADYKIEYCKGCISRGIKDMCMSTGRCIINDDVNLLKDKLYKSDGIILATPSYGIMETARMKNFLIDRIGMYTVYTSRLAGKYFVGVSTCGGIGAKTVAKKMAEHFISGFHKRAFMSGYIGLKIGNERIENKTSHLKKAYKLGNKLFKDIDSKKKYPFQKVGDRLITLLLVRRIILNNIYKNKDGSMKAVYEDLANRNLIR